MSDNIQANKKNEKVEYSLDKAKKSIFAIKYEHPL